MFIEYVQPSPRAGVQEHVSQTTAAALIAAGFAKEVELTEEERKALRFGTGTTSSAGHTIPPYVPTPTWSVIKHTGNGEIFVRRSFMSEVLFFNGVPDLKRWPDLTKERAKELAAEYAAMKAHEKAQAQANDKARHAR